MAEMAKGEPHPPADAPAVVRPHHFARRDAKPYAVAVDTRGELYFRKSDVGGDHMVVLLGGGVLDTHLAELAGDGISYIVSGSEQVDLAASLAVLKRELGVETLLLEGGGAINGSFLAEGLVDELNVIVAPALDARRSVERFVSFGEEGLADKIRLSLTGCERLDYGAVHLRYGVRADDQHPKTGG